jgi:hypothetical protein
MTVPRAHALAFKLKNGHMTLFSFNISQGCAGYRTTRHTHCFGSSK